ncbi:G-protein coupled receptor 157-like [Saccostrea echinata]|uniref:G-protein coupled receptor 157-like n=1 Tax=Saccostrea echinata TaxID=191078 RepID=UPI002A841E20|nr:G-protein coupled receptor 157-like [Saccostrea echinata]
MSTDSPYVISNITAPDSLPSAVVVLTMVSCLFSVAGAVVIFVAYYAVEEARNQTRRLLVYITIADLLTCLGNLIGSIRYFHRDEDDYVNRAENMALDCSNTDSVCVIQSFVTTFSTLASFFWTCIIMLHILMTLYTRTEWTGFYKRVIFHIISWGVPMIITLTAAFCGALGEDFSISTGPWCWIKGCLPPSEVVTWMFVTAKFWELSTYILTTAFYLLIKFVLWRRQILSFRQRSNDNLREEDQLYTMIFLVLIPLRIFGTGRFFIAYHKTLTNNSLVTFSTIDKVLLYLQSIGDSGQAFCNCILFCVRDGVVRSGLVNSIRHACQCRQNDETERLLPTSPLN